MARSASPVGLGNRVAYLQKFKGTIRPGASHILAVDAEPDRVQVPQQGVQFVCQSSDDQSRLRITI